jgi:hypothetical protein
LDLYRCRPTGHAEPTQPAGFDELLWAPHPTSVADLEATLRDRLRTNPRSRAALAAQTIGWLYSGWQPDSSV